MPKSAIRYFLILLTSLCFLHRAHSQVIRKKNIPYVDQASRKFHPKRNLLDIYFVKDPAKPKPIVVFIHGGSWGSGNKNLYWYLGKHLAQKGFVSVIINYPLAPDVQYKEMTMDCVKAVAWVRENASAYGGDPERIFLAGHSAGGHLAAYITFSNQFEKLNIPFPVKGVVLIDPFGLDLPSYFEAYDNRYSRSLYKVFTSNPSQWKAASPLYNINQRTTIPFLILTGERTYRVIREQASNFQTKLVEHGFNAKLEVIKHKKHIAMITQFHRRKNRLYQVLQNFCFTKDP